MSHAERHERLSFAGFPLSLPGHFIEFRPWQIDAIEQAVELYREGKRVVMIDAPTGAGKTLIGESIGQLVSLYHCWSTRGNRVYVCTSLPLQSQFLNDFPDAALIKGRSNYPILDYPESFPSVNAGDCTKTRIELPNGNTVPQMCPGCDRDVFSLSLLNKPLPRSATHCHQCHPWEACPYEVAKQHALRSPLVVANTSYLLAEANSAGRFGYDPDRGPAFGFMTVDEADTLEEVLMGHIELTVSSRAVSRLGLGTPKKTVASSWLEWLTEAERRSADTATGYDQELAAIQAQKKDPPSRLVRDLSYWTRLHDSIVAARDSIKDAPDEWVYQEFGGSLSLRPIRVSAWGPDLLWRHADRWLLMSATLISPTQVARDLGLEDGTWGSVSVDSPFPKERRPIIIRPAADMSYKTKDEERPWLHAAVLEILDCYPAERVLIHTVSYELAEHLLGFLRSTHHAWRVLTYAAARERDETLAQYRRMEGAVLVAPSLERGVDLRDEQCRVVIVCKVPFPSLGDKQIEQRLYGTQDGRSWYATRTIRSLVQMTGRGMRHAEDQCTSFVLDRQFLRLWGDGAARVLFPRWWSEALVWEGPRAR